MKMFYTSIYFVVVVSIIIFHEHFFVCVNYARKDNSEQQKKNVRYSLLFCIKTNKYTRSAFVNSLLKKRRKKEPTEALKNNAG